jgi:hypothetical protein
LNSNVNKNFVAQTTMEYRDLIISSDSIKINQVSHELVIGDAIYLDSDELYKKSTLETNFNVIGFVSNVIDSNSFEYKTYGKVVTDRYNYNLGSILYLSSTGELCDVPESIIKPVAIQVENGFIINIRQAIFYY